MQFNRFLKKPGLRHKATTFEISAINATGPLQRDGATEVYELPIDSYIYFCLEQGSGTIAVDMLQSEVEEHSICFLKPGQAFNATVHEPCSGFVISFAKEFIDLCDNTGSDFKQNEFLNAASSSSAVCIQKETYYDMKEIAGKMLQEFQSEAVWRSEVIKGFLKIFMIYFNRQAETCDRTMNWSRKVELTNRFFALLEKNYTSRKLVRDYAGLLAVTPGYLNEIVKLVSGFAASHHIQQRIILQAKRMAAFENDSLKEIAYHLGFEDPAHFSKYFKNFSGLNFREFKRSSVAFV